jgi:diadenosine tetraphosphate (Ap4A) HIT family hydrolase
MNTVVKNLLPRTWRTEAMHQKYEQGRAEDVGSDTCPLCEAPSKSEFKHWRIVENIYPYDAVALVHDMLVTKRHISKDRELSEEEIAELYELKDTVLNETYTFVMEALPKNKSVPGHYHLHLIVSKVIT